MHPNIIRHILIALLAMIPLAASAQDNTLPPVVINVSADSSAVTLGSRSNIRVELIKNSHNGVFLDHIKTDKDPDGKDINSFFGTEIRQISVDSAEIGNGRVQVNYNYLIQPFDVGTATFGPFNYALDGDTISSSSVSIKVIEPEMPQVMRDSLWINPMENVVSVKARWYDIIPEWWPWALISIAAVALIVLIIFLYRKNGPRLIPVKKIIPPHVQALQRLNILKNKKLSESGHIKEYYTELTDILRQYLHGRFGIYAREMTSPQILEACREIPEIAPFEQDLTQLLTTADFVKFAKQNPGVDENIRSFSTVKTFVNSTIPVEKTDEKQNSAKKSARKTKSKRKKRK